MNGAIQMHSYTRTVNTLAEGVELVLRSNPDLINRPESFYGALLDVYDHEQRTPEMQVMGECLDSCMLKPFAAVIAHQGPNVSERLESATRQATNTLIQDCYISEDVAQAVAQQLATGVSRYVGVATTPITPSPVPTTTRVRPSRAAQLEDDSAAHTYFEPAAVTKARNTRYGMADPYQPAERPIVREHKSGLVIVLAVLLAASIGGAGVFFLLPKPATPTASDKTTNTEVNQTKMDAGEVSAPSVSVGAVGNGSTGMTLTSDESETTVSASSDVLSASNTLFTMSQLPRTWRGTYDGYSEYTKDNSIERKVSISLTHVEENGELTATCSIGVEEDTDGATHGTYEAKGSVNWDDGSIWLVGTRWLDQGGLLGMGGFKGAIDPNAWTIEGYWYDPEGEASDGSWYMTAV